MQNTLPAVHILKILLPAGILLALPKLANATIYAALDNGEEQSTAASSAAAPYGDPGFNNVGLLNSASCVYLGTYATGSWVISARHVWEENSSVSTVVFGGTTYGIAPDSCTVLANPNQNISDLCIFRVDGSIASNVALHNLSIIENTPPVGTYVRMIGNGDGRDGTLRYWDATWAETTQASAVTLGFNLTSGRKVRWADNSVASTNISLDDGTVTFWTLFGEINQGSISLGLGQGQATSGDSGGATFAYVNNEWVLAGILEAVGSILTSSPGTPMDRVFMGEITASADLSIYREQIMTAIPEAGTLIPLVIAGACAVALRRHRRKQTRPMQQREG
ncbi:MAG: hypothetical protein LBD14_05605 [Puniceicoccales bacterium]|jgi:hypothetical protein|nr:hypothetical protein [Puniceicoccales bacterium]